MAEKDLAQLRQILREALRASGMGVREMERRLELGHGSLYRMLDGTLDLRVRHLLGLAELLGVPPADFLAIGCPEAMERAKRPLSDWIGAPTRAREAAEPAAASLTVTELRELIRGAVRDAVCEEMKTKDGSPPPKRRSRR
jgi:hypothetical protein